MSTESWQRRLLALLAFFALSCFVALEYAELVSGPPAGRVLLAAATVSAGCGLLAAVGGVGRGAVGSAVVLLTLVAALLAVGVPAHLLAPGGWGALGRHLRHGIHGLEGWLWPYRGGERWARLAVLALAPVGLLLAGAVCFWPSERGGGVRRAVALAALLALFLAGAANTRQPQPALRGLVLLVLLAAWLWLPRMRAGEVTRAARWLVACAVVGLIAEPLLSSATPWIDYRETSALTGGGTSFQWDQLYGPIDWSRSAALMLTVNEPQPTLLRVTSLDRFDGIRFLRSSEPPGSESLDVGGGARPVAAWFGHATVRILGLRSRELVAAGGPAVGVHWLGGEQSQGFSRESDGTIATPAPASPGSLYTVVSYAPTPSSAQLRAAPRAFPAAYLPYTQFDLPSPSASGLKAPELALETRSSAAAALLVGPSAPGATPASEPATARRIEASPYGPMFALARRLAAGARSSYEVAERIEGYLLANYTYDEHVAPARYPLEAFLFSQRRGYCQQFSGAMTLMLRMDGIPARVAAGFKPAIYDRASGNWEVRALDAHSWVEVFFGGIGWVTFDPTPNAPAAAGSGSAGTLSKSALLGDSSSTPLPHAVGHPVAPTASSTRGAGGGFPFGLVASAISALLLLCLGGLWLAGALRLRRGLRGDVAGAVTELDRALARLQSQESGPVTLAQLQVRMLETRHEAAAGYLARLSERRFAAVQHETASGYPHRLRAVTGGEVAVSARGRGELRRALAAGGGLRMRLRALLALPPAMSRR